METDWMRREIQVPGTIRTYETGTRTSTGMEHIKTSNVTADEP
jgi:hypothetical protein